MRLIIGLGNPGRQYLGTRHNVGFAVLGALARRHGINFEKSCCRSRVGEGYIEGVKIVLAKPQTYMNLSGEAVAALVRRYRVSSDDIIIVHDDIDLPLGRIRIRGDGSAGGHNGVKSIIGALGTKRLVRLKIGIGRPESETVALAGVVDHVLSGFSPDERQVAAEAVANAVKALEAIIGYDLETAMNRFN